MRKFGVTAGDDLENLTNVLGEGASRLQGMFIVSFGLEGSSTDMRCV